MTPVLNDELRKEVLNSKKFLLWRTHTKSKPAYGRGEGFKYVGKKYTNLDVDEKHFAPSELATAWGVSPQTIRDLFKDEEGVLKLGSDGNRNRRAYKTLRIPESVAERVHARLSA
jgi:hypothetical protein